MNNGTTSFLLLLSLGVSLGALVVTTIRLRRVFTPFHICSAIWSWQIVTAMFPLIAEDPFQRTKVVELGMPAQWVIFFGALTFLVGAFYMKPSPVFRLHFFEVKPIIPEAYLAIGFAGLAVVSAAVAYIRLGTFPILLMGKYSGNTQVAYTETNQGLITAVGWGAARALAIWLIIKGVMNRVPLRSFLSQNAILIASTGVALICNTLDGMRNLLIVPFILASFALSMRWGLLLRYTIPVVLALGAFFVVMGQFRAGNLDMASRINFSTGSLRLDAILAWFICYTEPSFANLNNTIDLNLPRTYGLVFLASVIPDFLFARFLEMPLSPVQQLQEAGMLAHPGLTLRTIYADLMTDFTLPGSVVLVFVFYLYAVRCFRLAYERPKAMIVYLCIAITVFNIPFMNLFSGIPALLPFALLVLLKFRPSANARAFTPMIPAFKGNRDGSAAASGS